MAIHVVASCLSFLAMVCALTSVVVLSLVLPGSPLAFHLSSLPLLWSLSCPLQTTRRIGRSDCGAQLSSVSLSRHVSTDSTRRTVTLTLKLLSSVDQQMIATFIFLQAFDDGSDVDPIR